MIINPENGFIDMRMYSDQRSYFLNKRNCLIGRVAVRQREPIKSGHSVSSSAFRVITEKNKKYEFSVSSLMERAEWINFGTATETKQESTWSSCTPLKSEWPSWTLGLHDDSIWISTHYDAGTGGMVQYCCSTNTMEKSIPYPTGFRPRRHSVSTPDGNTIVIVDGNKGQLTTFNIDNQQFGEVISIPALGGGTSCINIQGHVHTLHGFNNGNNDYLVYSTATGQMTRFKDTQRTAQQR